MPALLACILLYAALLRLDALFKAYGPYENPRWLAAMQPSIGWAAPAVTPDWRWRRVASPYAGGDPINYLKYAREMQSFYAAHVREPMFPAATRIGLALTGDADVGISVTSITFALLTLVATYALGARVASPAVGLAAAAALGIDQSAVEWSIGGWRDELFAFFAISCTWAWLRLAQRPSYANAAIAGVLSGGACLTRITSISLIAPAVVWLLVTRGRAVRSQVALAVGLMAALAAPFLINCALATGDPLYAINNHTDFYLKREGAPDVTPISALGYSADKFETRPIAAADNAMLGIFVYPFANKWVGLNEWLPGLGTTVACLAVGGLVAWLWQPDGRLLLFMFLGSLIPFSMTWTVRGGAEWRLTLFAYAFYLIAAFCLVDRVFRAATWRDGAANRTSLKPLVILLALLTIAAAWTFLMPYAVVREGLANGAPVTIMAGQRDRWFFVDGWSSLDITGNVVSRLSTQPTASLRLFLPDARPYGLILRIDPAAPPGDVRQKVQVSLNVRPLGELDLNWNPDRIGEYSLSIPAEAVTPGSHRLALSSETSFKLWYLRIIPQ